MAQNRPRNMMPAGSNLAENSEPVYSGVCAYRWLHTNGYIAHLYNQGFDSKKHPSGQDYGAVNEFQHWLDEKHATTSVGGCTETCGSYEFTHLWCSYGHFACITMKGVHPTRLIDELQKEPVIWISGDQIVQKYMSQIWIESILRDKSKMSTVAQSNTDWYMFCKAAKFGHLMEFQMRIPRNRWAERSSDKMTFLHLACMGPNPKAVVALIKSKRIDVNACDDLKYTPVHNAIIGNQVRSLEFLIAANADLMASNKYGCSPLDCVLEMPDDSCARVLIANGVRLRGVDEFKASKLKAFERGVLRCRSAVTAMFRIAKIGKLPLGNKLLFNKLAVCVWATRYSNQWSK